MDKLLEALAKVDELKSQGHNNRGIMGSSLNMAVRELERAYGEYIRSI